MKNYGDQTTAVLTGFVFGSLGFIWPWKKPIFAMSNGQEVFNSHGEAIVEGYNKYLPELSPDTFIAIGLMVAGIALLCIIEELSKRKNSDDKTKKSVELQ
jgi:hypothetical protein